MSLTDQAPFRNRLLRQLAPDALTLLDSHMEPIVLAKGTVLSEPGQPFEHATFPESGILSVISVSPKGQMAESGLVGREGFVPMDLTLDVDRSPLRCIVQVPGTGHRIAADVLKEALTTDLSLQRLLLHYAHTMAVQASYTALSNAAHTIDVRLARWLLMCHDRVTGYELAITHEFLSLMLAVRRASVTTSLHVLEGHRLIRSEIGRITVIDRKGLEGFAGDAYGACEAEYERLLGPLTWLSPETASR